MLGTITNWDHSLFLLINRTGSFVFFDWLMPIWTDFHKTSAFKFFILPILLLWVLYKFRIKGLYWFLATILVLGINDAFLGNIIKPFFARQRPPKFADLEVILRAPEYGGFSMPSNHASNMFCLAAFLGCSFPKLRWPLFFIATITAYSRVYCGVHFPLDVVIGALWGSAFGYFCSVLFKKRISRV